MKFFPILKSTLVTALLVLITLTSTIANNPSEYNLVLIGVVVDDLNEYPVEGAVVELKDGQSDQTFEFSTFGDGNFYFKLAPERMYTVSVRNENGELIYTKKLSTIDNDAMQIINDTLIVAAEDL